MREEPSGDAFNSIIKLQTGSAHVPSNPYVNAGAILTVIVGFAAISTPYLFSALVARFIGIFCVVSGVFLLFSAIFGKTRDGERVLIETRLGSQQAPSSAIQVTGLGVGHAILRL